MVYRAYHLSNLKPVRVKYTKKYMSQLILGRKRQRKKMVFFTSSFQCWRHLSSVRLFGKFVISIFPSLSPTQTQRLPSKENVNRFRDSKYIIPGCCVSSRNLSSLPALFMSVVNLKAMQPPTTMLRLTS